jgi:hypothetical protein
MQSQTKAKTTLLIFCVFAASSPQHMQADTLSIELSSHPEKKTFGGIYPYDIVTVLYRTNKNNKKFTKSTEKKNGIQYGSSGLLFRVSVSRFFPHHLSHYSIK